MRLARCNDKDDSRKLFPQRNCKWRFRPVFWDRDDRRIRSDVAAQLVAQRSCVAVDRRNSGSFPFGGAVLSDRIKAAAQSLANQQAVGWFQGRMEFGPRALGARSIPGDPRSPAMQRNLNLKVRYRESFRPFAPSVLRENVSDCFELDCDSPYMLIVADVCKDRRRAAYRKTSSWW
jgi:Carbamoyltransferase C-terminus